MAAVRLQTDSYTWAAAQWRGQQETLEEPVYTVLQAPTARTTSVHPRQNCVLALMNRNRVWLQKPLQLYTARLKPLLKSQIAPLWWLQLKGSKEL